MRFRDYGLPSKEKFPVCDFCDRDSFSLKTVEWVRPIGNKGVCDVCSRELIAVILKALGRSALIIALVVCSAGADRRSGYQRQRGPYRSPYVAIRPCDTSGAIWPYAWLVKITEPRRRRIGRAGQNGSFHGPQ